MRIAALAAVAGLLVACGAATPPAATGGSTAAATGTIEAATAGTAAEAAGSTERVTLGLGFIPNVQFAPFYVAASKGYYTAEGLDVEFSYGNNVNDLLVQTAAGKVPFAMASGDEVLLARAQGVPVKMVFLLYQKVPVAVFSKQATGIARPEDLRGKTIGLPGRYGATYIGLRGLLYAKGMQEQDVTLNEIGFAQFEAVSQDKVPAAVGFANNEPLRLAETGVPVNVIKVADYIQLVNNGIVISEEFGKQHPETVHKFVRATRKGLEATLADPDEAFKLSLSFIPELTAEQRPFQRKVLVETLNYWRTPETDKEGLGRLNPPAWGATYTFLRDSAILARDTDPEQAYSMEFLK